MARTASRWFWAAPLLSGAGGALVVLLGFAVAHGALPAAQATTAGGPLDRMTRAQDARAALIEHSDGVADLVAYASPSVVHIASTRVVERPMGWFSDPRPFQQRGAGSGVIIDPSGLLVTNHHVIEGASALRVTLPNGQSYAAERVGTDPGTDLAVLRLVETGGATFAPLPLATELPRPGETVLAIGSPFGLSNSVTAGMVSAVGRGQMGITEFEDFIQTDAAINPGNSGGALVNARGELVGINTAIYSRSGGSQGIGFAVPSTLVASVTSALLENGRVSRGWLGVGIADDARGVRLTLVDEAGPAAAAGLARGDLVTAIDGEPVGDAESLRNRVTSVPAGTVIEVDYERKGAPSSARITLDERPSRQALMQRMP